jgi:hypothetical protein
MRVNLKGFQLWPTTTTLPREATRSSRLHDATTLFHEMVRYKINIEIHNMQTHLFGFD